MSWICKRCETENPDIMDICEVCDTQAPRIINFTYDKLLEDSPVNICWEKEYCDKVIISYGGKQVDVTKESSYEILNYRFYIQESPSSVICPRLFFEFL